MKLKPYPDYKDSGLPWLGKIPVHWEKKRAKFYFREIDVRSQTGEEELLSVSHLTGVTPRSQKNVTMFKAETYVGHKLCQPRDIVVNTMWAWMAALGVAKQTGVVSASYAVYRPRTNGTFVPEYLDHLLRTQPYAAEYVCRSTGIRPSRLRLYPEQFLDILVLCPPLEEQEHIVAHLRAKDRQIARFIHNKQRLIELLNEQKQAIINRAVIHGLDWLGEVPEHWVVKPLKQWAVINSRVLPETTDSDYEFRYLDIGAVGTGFLVEQPERMRFGDAPSRARRILKKGDTIISAVRTYLKAVYFVSDEVNDLVVSTGFAVLTPSPGVVPEFLSFVIQSNVFVERVTAHSVGIAYPAIAETRLGAFHIALPTTEHEQQVIVEHIKTETRAMDEAIQRAHRETDRIREYHTRLIADVVTGKLDVRHLPVEKIDEALEDIEEVEAMEVLEAFEDQGEEEEDESSQTC